MPQSSQLVRTYCRICVAACGLLVEVVDDDVSSVRGDPDNPLTHGYTCPKGRALAAAHRDPERLDRPMMRVGDRLVEAPWDEVLGDLAGRLRAVIDESGRDAVATYFGSQISLDGMGRRAAEMFVQGLGSKSVYTSVTTDCPSKPLVSHAMLGHPMLLPIGDLGRTRLALFVGANPVVSHGHTWAMSDPITTLRELRSRARVWVLDPRTTETARLAHGHLTPRPGTDHLVLAHLVREVLRAGADREYVERYTEGVEVLREAVAPFDRATVADASGVDGDVLDALVADVRAAGRVAVLTGTGTTMGPVANAVEWLAMALAGVTGSLDRAGGMWFNPGHLNRLDRVGLGEPTPLVAEPGPPSRPELPRRWGQYPVAGLLDEIETGNVRALVAVGGNLMASAPQPRQFAEASRRLDVFAVAEIADSAQVQLATHVLACAGQLERADATNRTEIFFGAVGGQYTPAVLPRLAERRPMWWAFAQLGARVGIDVLPAPLDPDEATDDDVLAGWLDADALETLRRHPSGYVDPEGPRTGWVVGTPQLPDGRIRLAPAELVGTLTVPAPIADLVLAPRRQVRHVNSQFLPCDRRDAPEVLVSPADAERLGLRTGERVLVSSPHGSTTGPLRVDDGLAAGFVSVPHGFTGDGEPNVGELVSNRVDVDPLTGMMLQACVPLRVDRVA